MVIPDNKSKRYCILTNPRSGSLWLESLLYSSIKHLPHSLMAGEVCEPEMYHLLSVDNSLNLHIISRDRDGSKYSLLRKTESCIRQSDTQQPFTMRLFCNTVRESSYLSKFISFLYNYDVCVIALVRDPFDCALSNIVAKNTGIYHSHHNSTDTQSMCVDTGHFKSLYMGACFSHSILSNLINSYSLPVIKYGSVISDLSKLGIVVDSEITLKKTYIKPYSEIIENYDELLESVTNIRQSFGKCNS